MPAFLDNDANVAALAEALVGAGKGMQYVFYTTISTGIGGCLVVDGKTVSGKHGFGGEVANIIIDRNREKVNYLNVGAIENIHRQIVAQRDAGKAILLVSLELDEVMNLSDRILVMYEGEIVGELDPKKTTVEELGLYMAGAKRQNDRKEATVG